MKGPITYWGIKHPGDKNACLAIANILTETYFEFQIAECPNFWKASYDNQGLESQLKLNSSGYLMGGKYMDLDRFNYLILMKKKIASLSFPYRVVDGNTAPFSKMLS